MTNHWTRAGDFTPQAEAYSRARPAYPPALIDRLVRHAGVSAGDPVADFGAGTGLFTAALAQRGFVVTALEPNAAMRERAPRLPNTTWLDGAFEASGLPTGSQIWITAAQAFHWARQEAALPELHRVLRPGGRLTVLWNDREPDRDPVVSWTRDLIRRFVPTFDEAYRNRDWAKELASTGHLTGVVHDEEHHTVPMSRERYLDLWRSHNRLSLAAGERFAELLREIERHLDHERIETVDVPYVTRSWTARRVDARV